MYVLGIVHWIDGIKTCCMSVLVALLLNLISPPMQNKLNIQSCMVLSFQSLPSHIFDSFIVLFVNERTEQINKANKRYQLRGSKLMLYLHI